MILPTIIKKLLKRSDKAENGLRNAIPKSWNKRGGGGIRILMIDTGTPNDLTKHPAVVPDYIYNRLSHMSFVFGETEWDLNGHATAMASIIHDWAPNAEILPYKAIDHDGHVSGFDGIYRALSLAAATELGVQVVSISLAGYIGASKCREPIRKLTNRGILVFAGAGNRPERGIAYPGKFDEVISVGAVDDTGKIAGFSPQGADLYMPGVDADATWLNGIHKSASGTSVACAAAAGLAACALSAGLPPANVREQLAVYTQRWMERSNA